MKRFCEIEATDLTERALRSEIAVKGYLLVRGVLPRAEVKQVLGDITQVLSAAGWLQPEHQPIERVANMRLRAETRIRISSGRTSRFSISPRFMLCRITPRCGT